MPGGRRNAYLRATAASAAAAAAARHATEQENKKCYEEGSQTTSIRHMPLPDIPRLSVFAFESLMCLLSLLVLATQYLNIYRTVFWLPHSHTRYVVNLYLIEPRVVVFIVVSVSRRLLWCVVRLVLTACLQHHFCRSVLPIARVAVVMLLGAVLVYCLSTIGDSLTYIKVVALAYPLVLYFFIFDLELTSFLEVIPPTHCPPREVVPSAHCPPRDESGRSKTSSDWCTTSVSSSRSVMTRWLLQHSCLSSSEGVRQEADMLSSHCYKRLTQVIYQTLVNVYYTTLIPCFFVPNSLHYDATWLAAHTLFVVLTCGVWYLIYCFPARFCDIVHRSVQHLGCWRRLSSSSSSSSSSAAAWQSSAVYRSGAVVRYGRDLYRAEAPYTCAEPGNSAHARLYAVFQKAGTTARNVLLLSCVCCSAYFAYLTSLYQWQQVLGTSLLLAAHFGAVYVLLRDYIVLRTMYRHEDLLAAQS